MSALVLVVRAPNPSPMTLSGTNSYIVAGNDGQAICIDPGPAIEVHVDALMRAANERRLQIAHIAVTHGHPDHAPAAAMLHQRTGAPVYAHEKGTFARHRVLREGESVPAGDTELIAIDTPGHTFDHLTFYEPSGKALFTGDVVLGEGTVLIAPPDGDMRAYQRTLHRLLAQYGDARTIYGGHGEAIADPRAKLQEYIDHRELRERQLLSALAAGPQTVDQLAERIYLQTPRVLLAAAVQQLHSYLIALEREGVVQARADRYEIVTTILPN